MYVQDFVTRFWEGSEEIHNESPYTKPLIYMSKLHGLNDHVPDKHPTSELSRVSGLQSFASFLVFIRAATQNSLMLGIENKVFNARVYEGSSNFLCRFGTVAFHCSCAFGDPRAHQPDSG